MDKHMMEVTLVVLVILAMVGFAVCAIDSYKTLINIEDEMKKVKEKFEKL